MPFAPKNGNSIFVTIVVLSLCPTSRLWAYQSADLSGVPLFPADNYWHWDISQFKVHPNSDNFVGSIGRGTSLHPDFGTALEGEPWGIPYVLVDKNQPKIPINFTDYGDESDVGPYPIPLTANVEGGPASTGDRHVLAVDKDAKLLYEMFVAVPKNNRWDAACGAVFDLSANKMRTEGWTSADAAGLPILPGLVRYDEIAKGEINHAIRMTVDTSQNKYLWPARHAASRNSNPNSPPMGLRFRLKASTNISKFPRGALIVATAMKKYGLIVADNGGNWFISGAPDDRMPDDEINALKGLKGSDFEAILTVDGSGNPIQPTNAIRFKPTRMHANTMTARWFNLLGRLEGIYSLPSHSVKNFSN